MERWFQIFLAVALVSAMALITIAGPAWPGYSINIQPTRCNCRDTSNKDFCKGCCFNWCEPKGNQHYNTCVATCETWP
jgi:hypothetical protein